MVRSLLDRRWQRRAGNPQAHRLDLRVEFSPDGVLLATADRSGGVFVWESDTAREYQNLQGHKGPVTDVAWRLDSNLLATASEDGTIKLWEMENGTQVKNWAAHPGGVASVRFAPRWPAGFGRTRSHRQNLGWQRCRAEGLRRAGRHRPAGGLHARRCPRGGRRLVGRSPLVGGGRRKPVGHAAGEPAHLGDAGRGIETEKFAAATKALEQATGRIDARSERFGRKDQRPWAPPSTLWPPARPRHKRPLPIWLPPSFAHAERSRRKSRRRTTDPGQNRCRGWRRSSRPGSGRYQGARKS